MNSHLKTNLSVLQFRPIQQLTADEQERLLEVRNNHVLRRNMMTAHKISIDEHLAWLQARLADENGEHFAVMKDGEIVGAVGMTGFSRVDRRADWGFYLHPCLHGRGFGTALGLKFLDHAFDKIEKLNAEVIEFNNASLALHQKLGFKEEGVRRRHVKRGGLFYSAILLGITDLEWKKRRREITSGELGG